MVEGDGVDSGGMSSILPDIFGLDDIGEYDIFISSTADKLGVVFADVKGVNIVVMYLFILFNHHIFRGIVETDGSVLWSCHDILSIIVEFADVDGSWMYFSELFIVGCNIFFLIFFLHGSIINYRKDEFNEQKFYDVSLIDKIIFLWRVRMRI